MSSSTRSTTGGRHPGARSGRTHLRDRRPHLLWLRHQGQYRLEADPGIGWRQYEESFPKLQTSSLDIISLECHNSHVPIDLIELVRGKKVMVGAIDVASTTIETPQEVAETLRKALRFVDADKLYPATNCGMAPLARHVARGKLHALSAGAQIVRGELSA